MADTGLVPDLGTQVFGQAGNGRRNGLVECLRPQAATQHQQAWRARALHQSFPGRRQGSDVLANRIAHEQGTGQGRGERHHHLSRQRRQPAVGHACHGILFMDEQGPPQQPGHQAARAGDETAHAQHRRGTQPHQHPEGLQQGQGQHERRRQTPNQALTTQATDPDPGHREAGLRYHPCLQALAGAKPGHRDALGAQYPCHGERGKHVATGTAGHDQDGPRAHARTLRRWAGSVPVAFRLWTLQRVS